MQRRAERACTAAGGARGVERATFDRIVVPEGHPRERFTPGGIIPGTTIGDDRVAIPQNRLNRVISAFVEGSVSFPGTGCRLPSKKGFPGARCLGRNTTTPDSGPGAILPGHAWLVEAKSGAHGAEGVTDIPQESEWE